MNKDRLNQIVAALNSKNVNQPCPRCSSNNFSVIGESEISVETPPPSGGLVGMAMFSHPQKATMPTIIVTCDNCGYISQHAQAALGLLPRTGLFGLGSMK